jgi:hypothetical protein
MSTLNDASMTFLRDQPIVDAMSRELEEAKQILKRHFREKHPRVYKGITYQAVPYSYLSVELAKAALGAKKVAKCTVDSQREYLSLPAHLRRGAIDLSAILSA